MSNKSHTLQSDLYDEDEHYMDHKQLEYFREKLVKWRDSLQKESEEKTNEILQAQIDSDLTDMATKEYATHITLQTYNRNDILTNEINKALQRINDGIYGYCEETGEKIGIARLEANPITLYCIEEQERREKQQRLYNNIDEDDSKLF
ncbi:TraR/DksA family transcriptional regulator [Neoehrlichia mikurensis]|uniref:TraR/DksA family transcriptional regulator n=1 Tax=Neoehrlichia mikurensis TaxID=89586 RepID=A0A9Q9F421_9RICK|nr:TraR/DksA family transcriptional regulator [Neoehrlichia mikurensis]QXK92293.1 TraR/DksA family transcriptional regulator [Neoehrlichia mikurensis]QXK92747.1 TraR/DksA family transcriptional regulator [Neoehrlichia mikurensis]QXK93988.1 TraR/DksA family transcriptional regulator [Neoehrlichia mikurensis]UTO55849.1 TraR/DksA family transcriptional regulator [Neoehrlichia mikurensis]UTO56764.1 TraR/DksA family transcriptional regulator [Neoehrlichia mikurensis]